MPVISMDTWLLLAVLTVYALTSYVLLHRAARRDAAMHRTLDQLGDAAHAQTQILARAFRTQIARNEADLQQEIITALLSSGLYADRAARDSLFACLPDTFTATLPRSDAASTDLRTLVVRAWKWRGDAYMLDKIVTAAIATLDGSDAGQTLLRIKGELDR